MAREKHDDAGRACGTGGPVLIVDDSAYARLRVRRFVESKGLDPVVEAADGDEALRLAEQHRPVLVLIDQVMRGREGIETARLLLERHPGLRIVMLTVISDSEVRQRALAVGISDVVRKTDWEALDVVLGA